MMRNRVKLGILFSVLFLEIGFASVATNLVLGGNIFVGTNESDFDVIFTKALIDDFDVSNTTISDNGKSLSFVTKDLSSVGDVSKLDFEVTNNSRQYDAMVEMICETKGINEDYYSITNNFPSLITAKTVEKGNVTVKLEKVSVDNISEEFKCTLNIIAKEKIGTLEETKACEAILGDGTSVGDKVDCGSESFYVIKNDGTNVRMLSEYNLMIGHVANYDGTTWTSTPMASPTGLQDSKAIGAIYKDESWNTVTTRYGTTAYSSGGTAYVGSIVENYVNDYKTKLENIGVKVNEATLITKEELNELGMVDYSNNNISGREWLYKTSYWTKSVTAEGMMWFVYSQGSFLDMGMPLNTFHFGVRPVISISVDDLK